MRYLFDHRVRYGALAVLAVIAIVQGCGGGGSSNPAGPSGNSTFTDDAAVVLTVEAVPRLVNSYNFLWFWWQGNFIPAATPSPGSGLPVEPAAAMDTAPHFDTTQQAWLWTATNQVYPFEFGPVTATVTANFDYEVQFIGSGGPQQTNAGATRMEFHLHELSNTSYLASGQSKQAVLNFTINGVSPFNASTGLGLQLSGGGTGTVATFSGGGSSEVNLDAFSFSANFPSFEQNVCVTATALIDMGPYSTELHFEPGEAAWSITRNGAPLNPPVASTEFLICH